MSQTSSDSRNVPVWLEIEVSRLNGRFCAYAMKICLKVY